MTKRILVVKLWAIGEVALSTPCIELLKAKFPQADIYFLVGDNAKDIIIGNPNIKNVIPVDEKIFLKPDILKLGRLIINLKKMRFDTIILLHHSRILSLFAFLIGAPERFGLNLPGSWSLNTANIISDSTVDNRVFEYLKVLRLISISSYRSQDARMKIYPTKADKSRVNSLMAENGLTPKKFIIFSPTGGENLAASRFNLNIRNKVWPLEYYRELSYLILKNISFKIVIVGGEMERTRVRYIKRDDDPRIVDMTGQMNLRGLLLLAGEAALSVTNDSGPMLVLSISSSPLIVIFGPTDPRIICPESDNIFVMRKKMDCSPCYDGSVFPNRIKDCRNAICMRAITPDTVFQKIYEILKK